MPKGVFPRKIKPAADRFWSKVFIRGPDDCWNWKLGGAKYLPTYPNFWTGTKQDGAHRFSLEMKLGRILKKTERALHTCDNKRCVNPNHLFAGTNLDNSRDMVSKGRKERGEDVYGAKLTELAVVSIRKLFASGNTMTQLAIRFGVTYHNIYAIIRGRSWSWAGGPTFAEKFRMGPAPGKPKAKTVTKVEAARIRAMGHLSPLEIASRTGRAVNTVRKVLKS